MDLKKVLVWCVVNWLLLAKTQIALPLTAKGTARPIIFSWLPQASPIRKKKTADTSVKLEFMTHKSKAHTINH